MSELVAKIVDAKKDAGEDAFLWLNAAGKCILWPDEESSVGDDGTYALERWNLNDDEIQELMFTGEVNQTA